MICIFHTPDDNQCLFVTRCPVSFSKACNWCRQLILFFGFWHLGGSAKGTMKLCGVWRPWIEKPVENLSVFMKIREISPDWFHHFSINRLVNLNFLNWFFLKKMVYQFRYQFIGNTDRFTGFGEFKLLSADRFTGLPVIPIQPIYRFSNVKSKFGVVFARFYWFSW
jgi:hypothetical protein